LDVEVENLNVRASFVLWDRECAQLLGVSAEQLRAKMIKVYTTFIFIQNTNSLYANEICLPLH
jgi:hypothetical protein